MKRAIIITARVGSSRLPRKHLMDLQGMKCIEHVFERAKRSKLADKVILCTTILSEDDILCNLAVQHNIEVFRGSIEDKLDRWNQAAVKYGIDVFATYDADDILCEPKLIDMGFVQQEKTNLDYIQWNENTMICGSFTYVIKVDALARVCKEKKISNTEMAFDFFEKSSWCKRDFLRNTEFGYQRPTIRLTLDYKEDYSLFKLLFQQFGRNIVNMDLKDIVKYFDNNPAILTINSFRHNDWKKNQERVLNAG